MVTAARSGSAVRAGCCASHAMSRKLSPAVGRNLSTEVTVLRLGRVPSSSLSSRRPETLYFYKKYFLTREIYLFHEVTDHIFLDTTGNSFEIFLEEEKYFSYLKPAASGWCHSVLIIATKMGPKVQIAAGWARHRQAMTATGRCNGRRREGS